MAPYMQTSPLPNNFVFICAGAIIGFFFLIVLAWRGLISWNIYRNIKRANAGRGPYSAFTKLQKLGAEGASVFKKPNAPFYSYGRGSELSLDPLTGSGKKDLGYNTPANRSSLFFSPTANTTATAGRSSAAGNRGSTYLPSGYYAAGNSGYGGGVAGDGRPISMLDFTNGSSSRPQTGYRPQSSTRFSRPLSVGGISPGPSPLLNPASTPADMPYGRSSMAGLSTASLGAKSDGRAPSAYLEDLFDYPPVPQRSVGEES
ncbi:MAG: hypothetical protein LQ340_000537 [Diploschistes diacapsis]|nr:MAG: hypothetical protein LQ340_000537 [Diploschistes diacapsis]